MIARDNSLTPGEFVWNTRYVIFNQILLIDGLRISCEIALKWMSLDITDDQSILVQIRQQAVTWANVDLDLCRYMVSLGHNELNTHRNLITHLSLGVHFTNMVKLR